MRSIEEIRRLCLLTKQDFWGLPLDFLLAPLRLYTCVRIQKNISPLQDPSHRRIRFESQLGIRDESFDGCVENLVAMKIKNPGSTEGAK